MGAWDSFRRLNLRRWIVRRSGFWMNFIRPGENEIRPSLGDLAIYYIGRFPPLKRAGYFRMSLRDGTGRRPVNACWDSSAFRRIDTPGDLWEYPIMTATILDDRRRLVMPKAFKPKAAVTVQVIDDETVLVKLAKPTKARMVMLLPDVKHLPDDPEWEKIEHKIVRHNTRKVTPFEE